MTAETRRHAFASPFEDALAQHRAGRLAEAEAGYRRVLDADADHPDALHLLGLLIAQRGDPLAGLELIERAIAVRPDDERFHLNRGNVLRQLGRTDEALAAFERALALRADYAEAWFNRGLTLAGLERFADALASFDRGLAANDGVAAVWVHRGLVLDRLGRTADALASYDRAVALAPQLPSAHHHRAVALGRLKRHDAAAAAFTEAARLAPDDPEIHYNHGTLLAELSCHAEAEAALRRALALRPDHAAAHYNLGVVCAAGRRLDEAVACYDRALALDPVQAQTHNNRAIALAELGRTEEALASYGRALALTPDWPDPYINRGHLLSALKRHPEALADYRRALALRPDAEMLPGDIVNAQLSICDWTDLDAATDDILARLTRGEHAISPFALLALPAGRARQRQAAARHAAAVARGVVPPALPPPAGDRIRLGYFSPDFHSHPVAYLSAGLFEHHDRSRFEVIAFSFGGGRDDDPMRRRIRAGVDRFIDVRHLSDAAIVALAREAGIAIAIDLAGYTGDARAGLFARRVAPVQVNYLGYPATMGLATMDYIVGDAVVTPDADAADYAEKRVLMPHCFQVNDAARAVGPTPTRAAAGLPEGAFVFCAFAAAPKLNPTMMRLWLRLLDAVAGSVLWLIGDSPAQIDNLRRFAARHGVAADRLVFAARAPYAEHLGRLRLADLALDTLPFNGGATTSDALWAGVPVVSCRGDTFAGRMAASLLAAAGLPDLVTESLAAYETLALDLAHTPVRLAAVRARLAEGRRVAPLFDTGLFTRHLEVAFLRMWQGSRAGQEPVDIVVPP